MLGRTRHARGLGGWRRLGWLGLVSMALILTGCAATQVVSQVSSYGP